MSFYKSFLVAIKDLQTQKIKIKHFFEEKEAIQYVNKNYKDVRNMSETIDLCEDIHHGFCVVDPCFQLLQYNVKNCVYYCLDEECDCVTNGDRFNNIPINIDRTIEEIYKSDRYIISIYYQVILT